MRSRAALNAGDLDNSGTRCNPAVSLNQQPRADVFVFCNFRYFFFRKAR